MSRRLIAAAVLALCAHQSFAATEQEAMAAYQAKQYPRAAALYVALFEAEHDALALYNAACSYALAGDSAQAFATLERMVAAGYLDAKTVANDSDFASIKADPRWQPLLERMKAAQAREARLFDSPALATPYAENISDDEKIAGLSKFWSEVKYNFVYTDTLKEIDWDRLYLDYLPKVRATGSTAEYYRVLMELCARLQDGHTNVVPPEQALALLAARPLLRTRLAEDRVFVETVFGADLEAQGLKPGLEIVSVDGVPTAQYRERALAPYVSASTPQDRAMRTGVYSFLSGPVGVPVRVGLADGNGKRFELSLPRVGMAEWNRARPPMPAFELRMLPGNVAYVALNGFDTRKTADDYLQAWPQISQASALVLDLRRNGGGSSDVGFRVLATLTDKPFPISTWSSREYVPTYRAWGRPLKMTNSGARTWQPDLAHQFTGPVVVLTSGGTYSAAEDFALSFDEMRRGPIVGEATGGSTGQPLFFALPGGGRARVCTKADTYTDGRRFVGVGIQPKVAARQSVADLHAGRDTVLETALMQIKK